jgi:hypothetical protein
LSNERHAMIPVFPLSQDEDNVMFVRGMEIGAHMIRMMVDEEYTSTVRCDNVGSIQRCAAGLGREVIIGEPDENGWCDIDVSANPRH